MVRRAANTAQDLIGPNYNRGTNMHLIPLTEEAEIDELEQLQAGTSWIIAAILGAVLIGKFTQPIINSYIKKSRKCQKLTQVQKCQTIQMISINRKFLEQIQISRNSKIHFEFQFRELPKIVLF